MDYFQTLNLSRRYNQGEM